MSIEKAPEHALDNKITLVVTALIALVGIGVIVGWHLHVRALVQVIPSAIAMQYNTAVCFIVLGASAFALATLRNWRFIPLAGGAFVLLMGGLVIFEYAADKSLGIDTLLFYPWEQTLSSSPGRMALTTAISFVCAGGALALLALRPRAFMLFAVAHALPLSFGLTSALGYLLDIKYVLPFNLGSQMAIHTSLAFTAYSGAMLAYAWQRARYTEDGLRLWSPAIAIILMPIFFVGFSAMTESDSSLSRIAQIIFAIGGASLLGIVVHRLIDFKVAYKGMILIAIPLIFVLGFVVLVLQLKRNNERAQDWSLHSKDVIAQTKTLIETLVNAESSVRGYVITNDSAFADAYAQAMREVSEASKRLQMLVSDNPQQEVKAIALSQKASAKIEFLSSVEQLMRSGEREQAVAQIKSKVGKQLMDDFRAEISSFLQEEERLNSARRKTVEDSWQRFNWLLVAGASADMLLAFLLAFLFSQGISGRLLTLTGNAEALAAGKELAKPLKGKDEISHLDHVFHQMAEALEAAARKERAVVDNALDVICAFDAEGKFAQVSPASLKVWGYRPDELIGRRAIELVVPEDVAKTNEAAQEIIAGQGTIDFENQHRRKDGSTVCIRWSAYWSEQDKLMFCVAHDVSERKQAEEKIKQLNENLEKRSAELELANKELEAFSYSVSHDLRAPLRAIDGFSRILLEDYAGKLDDEGLRYLNVVCKNTKQMGQLIDDLLAFSRLSRKGVEKSNVDMNKLAASIVEELQSFEDGRSFDLTLHPMPAAQGDGAMIRQVLVNLISNALKFTRHKAEAKIEIGANGAGRAPVYYVKDNGAGFDMQYADKLFGVFQRLHSAEEFEGTGVGLAIVQRIIQRHGGRVWAEAKPGDGAAFYFTITGDGEKQDGDEHQRSGDTFS